MININIVYQNIKFIFNNFIIKKIFFKFLTFYIIRFKF